MVIFLATFGLFLYISYVFHGENTAKLVYTNP